MLCHIHDDEELILYKNQLSKASELLKQNGLSPKQSRVNGVLYQRLITLIEYLEQQIELYEN